VNQKPTPAATFSATPVSNYAMSVASKRTLIAILGLVIALLAVITVLAKVKTPYCPEIMHIEGVYKIGSLCIFIQAFYFLAWRRFSLTAALLIPLVQLASGFAFASYINILPKICLN
jgi:hypothetical protein